MKNVILGLLVFLSFISCSENNPEVYTGRKLSYQLNMASEYEYTGTLEIKELTDGNLELSMQLFGAKSGSTTTFPAHLHYGNYSDPEASMAFMLNPISGSTLTSVTILGELIDGTRLNFDDMKTFDGHIKVHLASEGPDYRVILVAGNIGSNVEDSAVFDPTKMTLCSPDF